MFLVLFMINNDALKCRTLATLDCYMSMIVKTFFAKVKAVHEEKKKTVVLTCIFPDTHCLKLSLTNEIAKLVLWESSCTKNDHFKAIFFCFYPIEFQCQTDAIVSTYRTQYADRARLPCKHNCIYKAFNYCEQKYSKKIYNKINDDIGLYTPSIHHID